MKMIKRMKRMKKMGKQHGEEDGKQLRKATVIKTIHSSHPFE